MDGGADPFAGGHTGKYIDGERTLQKLGTPKKIVLHLSGSFICVNLIAQNKTSSEREQNQMENWGFSLCSQTFDCEGYGTE